jgi:uncharacterized membrane protein YhhN
MKTKIITLLYFLTGFLFIIFQNQLSVVPVLLLKALIIPVLIILLITNCGIELTNSHRLMFSGLFFSWAGDVILEFSKINGNLFIGGLVCFLLAHVMYFIVFTITPGKNAIFGNRIYLLIPVILTGTGLIYYLWDDLDGMRLPVTVYAIVILTMLTGAINRLEKVNRTSFILVLGGAILFVISDSAIAVNKFSYKFESSGIVIMTTYIIAQYLIITGYIKQFSEHQK